MMKTIGILVLVIVLLWLWNQGVFTRFMPSYIKEKKLSEKYGGVYVFYPEFIEEIKKGRDKKQEINLKVLKTKESYEN